MWAFYQSKVVLINVGNTKDALQHTVTWNNINLLHSLSLVQSCSKHKIKSKHLHLHLILDWFHFPFRVVLTDLCRVTAGYNQPVDQDGCLDGKTDFHINRDEGHFPSVNVNFTLNTINYIRHVQNTIKLFKSKLSQKVTIWT